MSNALENVLIEAINDEYKACATYLLVIEKFGQIRPFINIVEAEKRHIQALLPLFVKYEVTVPPDDWKSRITTPETELQACQIAVEAEVENAEMYERLLAATAEYPDVQSVFEQLQCASQENHLPAFRRCVERGGKMGQGQGGGQGHGMGRGQGGGKG